MTGQECTDQADRDREAVGLVASGFETVEELDLDALSDPDMTQRVVTLLRREDMLVLEFRFSGITRLGTGAGQRLTTASPTQPGSLLIRVPPQAMLEEATTLGGASTGVKKAWLSDASQIELRVPAGSSIPFSAAGLLGWAGLATASAHLECVWGLPLAPVQANRVVWLHGTEPVTGPTGATGIWHTRLALPPGPGPLATPSRLPVPVKSAGEASSVEEFTGSLSATARRQIAAAMDRRPVEARDTSFSALGASVDLTGNWTGVPGVGVILYRHQSVIGRDTTVNIVQRGYLWPFGFPVHIATQTERRLDLGLVQTSFLTVMLPEVTYDGVAALPNEGRAFPFQRVRLDGPLVVDVSDKTDRLTPNVGFWVRGPGATDGRLRFALTAEDRRCHTVSFTAPLVFIDGDRAHGNLGQAVEAFNAKAKDIALPASGRLELAPATGADKESTTVEVAALRVGAEVSKASQPDLEAAGRLGALPRLIAVEARLPALDALASRSAAPLDADGARSTARMLRLDEKYVKEGPAATHQVYARLDTSVGFAPPVTNSGGLAKLDLPVNGLSSAAGLVGGDLEKFKSGTFDPESFFTHPPAGGGFPTRLLGVVDLTALVESVPDMSAGDGEKVPRMVTEVKHPPGKPPEEVRTTLTWRPDVKTTTAGSLTTTADTTLDIRSTTVLRFDGTAPRSEVHGELHAFDLTFAEVLKIHVKSLAFTSKPGTTPSLDVKVGQVTFAGSLRFLDRLREYLPSPANGPRIAVDSTGVAVGYSLAIPGVGVGVFMLQNLTLSTEVVLPFNGTPVRASFAVSSREHPFLLTVSLFGGGGFLKLTVETGEVVALEGQVEFGAAVALNVGVASGSVCVTAGVYIKLKDKKSAITGFFRAVGELDILGIVNISVEFYLGLTYEPPKTLRGTATVTVRVRVAFFSKSVSMSLERSFSGGDDPDFAKAFPTAHPWQERCAAFAAMVDA
ncbi:hypothetical protein ACFTWS_05575 [Streptomyces sp. NPDC057027]|uniref:hypothetical protein n=1 Tax=Streptomyces sp. NPDC057027 TaxID=3346004 RepID=UPI0036258283